jgi:hypothetical protein
VYAPTAIAVDTSLANVVACGDGSAIAGIALDVSDTAVGVAEDCVIDPPNVRDVSVAVVCAVDVVIVAPRNERVNSVENVDAEDVVMVAPRKERDNSVANVSDCDVVIITSGTASTGGARTPPVEIESDVRPFSAVFVSASSISRNGSGIR